MSVPSASGDEQDADFELQTSDYVAGSEFLGGLPRPRSNSELHQDSTTGDTHSSLASLAADAKQNRQIAPLGRTYRDRAPRGSKKINPPAGSRALVEDDAKTHAGKFESDDERSSVTDSSASDSENDSGEVYTVFDAVAGRLGYDGLLKPNQRPVSAFEYLFRHQQGPVNDESFEQFSAHRHLEHRLPDSDLLKAIHTHASDFYDAMRDGQDSFESMDETALIAMGILLEEATAEGLGETGDLAFVEVAPVGEADRPSHIRRKIKRQKVKHEGEVKNERETKAGLESSDRDSPVQDQGHGKKRRRGVTMAEPDDPSDGSNEEGGAHPTEEGPSHNSDVESWISQTFLDSQGQTSNNFGTPSDLPIR